MELKTCFPTPIEPLPPLLSHFVKMGEEARKATENLHPEFSSEIIAEINYKVCRLWTYAMATGKAFSMMLGSPNGHIFVAFIVKDGDEYHSVIELPNGIGMLLLPTLLTAHEAVADEELNAILCMTSEMN